MVSIGEKGEYQVYLAAALMVSNRTPRDTCTDPPRKKVLPLLGVILPPRSETDMTPLARRWFGFESKGASPARPPTYLIVVSCICQFGLLATSRIALQLNCHNFCGK